ncbi:MAG TPA: ParA family protein [Pseudohaliea sp.]|nr:ParA family protein [Pseudohaliea sp.]
MQTLASYNLKGGVGKTATAVNLAYLAAASGRPTLLWDLDPQGAAGWYLGVEPGLEEKPRRLLKGKAPLGREVRPTGHPHLDLLPADRALRHLDLRLDELGGRNRVAELLAPSAERYALVVLDCPPSSSRLAENVLAAADAVLAPLIPTPLSLRAWEQMLEQFGGSRFPVHRLWPFFTMVDRRRGLHRRWSDDPAQVVPGALRLWVPYATEVERMGLARRPLEQFAPRSPAAHAYRGLWREVQRRLGGL